MSTNSQITPFSPSETELWGLAFSAKTMILISSKIFSIIGSMTTPLFTSQMKRICGKVSLLLNYFLLKSAQLVGLIVVGFVAACLQVQFCQKTTT